MNLLLALALTGMLVLGIIAFVQLMYLVAHV